MPDKNSAPRKKPSPAKPKQIENEQIKPYDLLGVGNPNPKVPHNRGNDVSVRNDLTKSFNITLGDLNDAVIYYINEKVKPVVVENNQQIPVPVVYAFSERWNAAQKEGALRDKEGRVLLPVIAINRDNITRNRTLGNKLDGNEVHQFQVFQQRYTKKNQYDNFAVLTNRIPVKSFFIAPVPDYVLVTYHCAVFTRSQEQLDSIIQGFTFTADSYWGQYDRFRFKATIDSWTNTIEYTQGEDRSVRSNFDLTLNAYLLPDNAVRDASLQKRVLSKAQVVFSFETTSGNVEKIGVSPNFKKKTAGVSIIDNFNVNTSNTGGGSSVPQSTLDYLNTSKEIDGTPVTSDSVLFSGSWLPAPPGFPSTSERDFTFFINGQFINSGSIVTFVDNNNGTSTLIVNTAPIELGGLGYNLLTGSVPPWQVMAIGKFQ